MLPDNIADRHREVARRFTSVVEGVDDWSVPTPVKEWNARGVVEHLTTWLPGFLGSGAGVALPEIPDASADPVAAWTAQAAAVQALLDDPATAQRMYTSEFMGTMPLPQVIDQFYTADVFMHTWDLARATGQNDTIDADHALEMVNGMEQMEDVLRASNQFGERQPVHDGATPQERLTAFIGRDPYWSPA